jgi:hypothetical protein
LISRCIIRGWFSWRYRKPHATPRMILNRIGHVKIYRIFIFIDKAHTHINAIHYTNSKFQILSINWSLNLKLKTQICSWRIIKFTYI